MAGRKRNKRSKKCREDRLSNLPDNILHKILSSLETKQAVQTSVLSKKWVNLWKSLPNLNLDSRSFYLLASFKKFVHLVLSGRDNSCNVDDLFFHRRRRPDVSLTNRVIKYAVSHGVQSLSIQLDFAEFWALPELLECQSIKTLALANFSCVSLPESSLFGSLTELHIKDSSFVCHNNGDFFDPFVNCINLKTFHLQRCKLFGSYKLKITGPNLVNLTISCMRYGWELYNNCEIELVAPKLSFFSFTNATVLNFTKLEVPSLENMNLDIQIIYYREWYCPLMENKEKSNRDLIHMLQGLHNAQSMTLSLDTIKVLTLVPGMLERRPSPFSRIKSLKLNMQNASDQSSMPFNVITYFLGDSPHSPTFEIEFPKRN